MISWMSKKQKFVAHVTAKVEYNVASMASCEAIWLRKLFGALFEHVLDTTVIYCHNKNGIRLAENLALHEKSRTLRSNITISGI